MLFKKADQGSSGASLDFLDAVAEAGETVYLLLRASDLFPLFISGNFERTFHMPPQRMEDDIEALYRLMGLDERHALQRSVDAWDKAGALTLDFPCTPAGCTEERSMRCTVAPVRGGSQYLVSFADISLEKEHLGELEGRLQSLSDESQIKADFLNKMSHEIRTPLNGILGMLTLARDHLDDRAELLEDLSKADELSHYLLTLVNDILDMSRIESGKVELELKPFSLTQLARDLRSMFEGSASEKGIALTVALQDCEDNWVLGDRLRLGQVIINLVGNALKFTPKGGSVDVVIKEMYRRDDAAHFMFRVRDTGKGMDPRFLGRLFRPFEQENASIAQQYGGSGLGMAIADSLVTLMGGEIVVDSAVGRGSDFAVYLPMQVTEAPAGQDGESGQEPPAPEGAQDAGFMDGLRMLMAEDNDVNAKITMSLLKKRGVQVERACNGEEAVELFAGHEPGYYDVILMDIKMPGIDGWEAARRIRKLEQEDPSRGRIALIALSANAFVEDERHSLEVGMDGHVGKPLDFDALDALIRRILPASQKKTKGTP